MRIALGTRIRRQRVLRLAVAAGRLRRAGRARARAVAGSRRERIARRRAGRTDAGVHATLAGRALRYRGRRGPPPRGCAASTRCCRRRSRVLWAQPVADDFHARFAAHGAPLHVPAAQRAPCAPRCCARRVGWYHQRARCRRDARGGAACLVGEHDFCAFRAAECQAKSPVQDAGARSPSSGDGRTACASTFRRTRSCITWCATSSARSSTSARAGSRRRGSASPRGPRPHARGADVRRGRPVPGGVDYDARCGAAAHAPRDRAAGRVTGVATPDVMT